MSVTLAFHGAAGTVTGSCDLLRHPGGAFLVDCGLFQGSKTVKELNYGPFPFDPGRLDFVLLTHAHIDHAGLLPKLMLAGFSGPIYATGATCEILAFLLPDSGYIQESEVERLNRRRLRRGEPEVEPIYRRRDAELLLKQLRPLDYGSWFEPGRGVEARYWNAGHILGAASIELRVASGVPEQRLLRLLFSGDIGPEHKLFHPDPEAPADLDYLIVESTYGARRRQKVTVEERRDRLRAIVKEALDRGGNLLIPAFAVERTQELIADLGLLSARGTLPKLPIFLDSPLAQQATETFRRYAGTLENLEGLSDPFELPNLHVTTSVEQSKALDRIAGGAVIIAASGMCEAGRIRYHLKSFLWRPDCTVLLAGFQAPGTLGHLLLEGKRSVRIEGEDVAVRAVVKEVDLYSGHADGQELADWVMERQPVRRAVFLQHGEEKAREALRNRLLEAGLSAERIILPQLDEQVALLGEEVPPLPAPARRLAQEDLLRPDWHNDYAQFLLDLRERLELAADSETRGVILRRLKRALSEPES